MKVVFFGTPEFAATSLQALAASNHEVLAVVTAPDRTGGRGGRTVIVSDVKRTAEALSIPVLQPSNLKSARFQRLLSAYGAELFVVVAFRMLPEAVWAMPPLGSVNVHGSLLPAYRGAAPIHWAIRSGESETGVSVFFLRHAIDTGDLLHQRNLPIGPDENLGEVYQRLEMLGATALLEALDKIADGQTVGNVQDDAQASHAPKLTRDNTRIDWSLAANLLHNEVRGLSPFPLAWTLWAEQEIKILRSRRLTHLEQEELQSVVDSDGEVGKNSSDFSDAIFGASPQKQQGRGGRLRVAKLRSSSEAGRMLFVCGGDGSWLELVELRPSGKTSMPGAAWANGATLGPDAAFE